MSAAPLANLLNATIAADIDVANPPSATPSPPVTGSDATSTNGSPNSPNSGGEAEKEEREAKKEKKEKKDKKDKSEKDKDKDKESDEKSEKSEKSEKDKSDKKEKKEKKDKKDKSEKDKSEKDEEKEKEKDKDREKKEKKEREKEEKERKEREKKEEKERKEREKKEEKDKKKDEENSEKRRLADEEEAANRGGWWCKIKDSFKTKPTTLKEIVQAAASGEATYRFDFTDFELDVLSNTTDEAARDARNMYSVHVERTSMTNYLVQQCETKWAGPAAAYGHTNERLALLRREVMDWQVNGQLLEAAAAAAGGVVDESAKMSAEEINTQADGSFFGIASAGEQGLEYVRCPTDFGTVKEAERYIVRHRWAPSFNVLPIFANIKRLEQLAESDPFGDTADTATPMTQTPVQAASGGAGLDASDGGASGGEDGDANALGTNSARRRNDRFSTHARTRSMGVDLGLGNGDDSDEDGNHNAFGNFRPDPNFSLSPSMDPNASAFPGYSQAHRRHTATYGGLVGIQQAVANHHQRTMSTGVGMSRTTSPSRGAAGTPAVYGVFAGGAGSAGAASSSVAAGGMLSPNSASLTPRPHQAAGLGASVAPGGIGDFDDHEVKPFITYNQTNQNCSGEGSTPFISTIGLNPCEAVSAKLKASKPTSSVVVTIRERTDVDLAALSRIGSAASSSSPPGASGRKFTQVRLDLTKGSIAAFGGQRYELYFFDDCEEAKQLRKKIKGKSDITGGLVPVLVLRFKVQGTMIDKETLADVTAMSPARRRLLQAKVLDVPAFPYAFVIDRFVVNKNVKASYNVAAGIAKVLTGSGVADVNIAPDGSVIIDKREKKEREKERKERREAKKKRGESSSDDSDDERQQNGRDHVNNQTVSSTAENGVVFQTTTLASVTRMQPLHLRSKFKLCNIDESYQPTSGASQTSGGLTFESGGSSSTTAGGAVGGTSPDKDKDKKGAASASAANASSGGGLTKKEAAAAAANLVKGPPLKFNDLYDCFVLTPQFATTRSMTIGDLFHSDSEAFAETLAEQEIPSVITEKDVRTLMGRPLIKFQCKTEDITTTKVFTHVVPCRGANVDLVLGSPCTLKGSPRSPMGDAASTNRSTSVGAAAEPSAEIVNRAYYEMLSQPNCSTTQERVGFSLAPYVSLNTFPLEGIPLCATFPRKQSGGAPHAYDEEYVTFRLRRYLLPSVTRAGLAPETQWDIPLEAFESEECPYRVHEPVLSLESFFEPLREEEEAAAAAAQE